MDRVERAPHAREVHALHAALAGVDAHQIARRGYGIAGIKINVRAREQQGFAHHGGGQLRHNAPEDLVFPVAVEHRGDRAVFLAREHHVAIPRQQRDLRAAARQGRIGLAAIRGAQGRGICPDFAGDFARLA